MIYNQNMNAGQFGVHPENLRGFENAPFQPFAGYKDFYNSSREFLEKLIEADPKNTEILKVYEKLISDYTEFQKSFIAKDIETTKLNLENNRNRFNQYQN